MYIYIEHTIYLLRTAVRTPVRTPFTNISPKTCTNICPSLRLRAAELCDDDVRCLFRKGVRRGFRQQVFVKGVRQHVYDIKGPTRVYFVYIYKIYKIYKKHKLYKKNQDMNYGTYTYNKIKS